MTIRTGISTARISTGRISKLLIANRGEIARHVIRSAHDMGIATVALYADGDADSPFVAEAGEAFALGGSSATETYLDVAKVLGAAHRSGADAVHPGYGFLSENAAFARAAEAAGLLWVGPPPDAIDRMGDKLAAKRLAHEVGVATLPSGDAETVGFPLLIKAAAGGGGKGMRVVAAEADLADATAGARREALASFGDETVFYERWLPAPRHVEIQILGDRQGELVHLGERECSIQRRHQKIIEEAPSPAVDAALRERMGEAALRLARAMGYFSTGTVEFLLDGDEFWFLEVNTRLQVEHPVTEAVTGLDLVREQLRVAAGEPLGYGQADIRLSGHAVEARLYAEDPTRDFLPVTGTVRAWRPAATPRVRFDSGVEAGSVVGPEFDPMLAKVIAHAPTRQEAALKLALALERSVVGGMVTNRDFLVATLRHPAFLAGDTLTDFIERHDPPRRTAGAPEAVRAAAVVAALVGQERNQRAAPVLSGHRSGWRNTPMPWQSRRYTHGDEELTVRYRSQRDDTFAVDVDGTTLRAQVAALRDGGRGGRCDATADVVIDGRRLQLEVHGDVEGDLVRWLVQGPDGAIEVVELPRFPAILVEGPPGGLLAPMPGKVIAARVAVGDAVEAGQLLVILEAMKMEHHITAPTAGRVVELRVAEGDQVDNGALLLVVDATS